MPPTLPALPTLLFLPALVAGCTAGKPGSRADSASDSTGESADSPVDSVADSLADSNPDSDHHSGADTADSAPGLVTVSKLDWRLDEAVESLVHVSWEQDGKGIVHVEYSFEADSWEQTPDRERGAGLQEQVLAGIPFGTDASWRVVPTLGKATDGASIATGPIPAGLPVPTVTVSNPDAWLPEGRFLLLSVNAGGGWEAGTFWTLLVDRQGRVVWAQAAPDEHWTLFPQVSADGTHILWDEATSWSDFDDGAYSSIHATFLDGEIERIYAPGLHDAFVELPDGTLAWSSLLHGGGEALVQKAPGAFDETLLWTCADWPEMGEDCNSNGLSYSPERDTFLDSFLSGFSVVEIDRSSGIPLWWAGGVDGGLTFVPEASRYLAQHSPSFSSGDSLLVSTWADEGHPSTWAREYAIDTRKATITETWSYDSGILAGFGGSVRRLSNGDTLHLLGESGNVLEVDASGTPVWRLELGAGHLLGSGAFVADLYDLLSKP
jgi:hypothetical protein